MIPQPPTTPPPSGVNESPRTSLSSEDASPRTNHRKVVASSSELLTESRKSPKDTAIKSQSFTNAATFSAPKVYKSSLSLLKTIDNNRRSSIGASETDNKRTCNLNEFFAALTAGRGGERAQEQKQTKKKKKTQKNNIQNSDEGLLLPRVTFSEDAHEASSNRASKLHMIEIHRMEKEKAYEIELEKLEKLRARDVHVDLEREAFLRESLVKLDAEQDPMLKIFQHTLVKETRQRSATIAVMRNSLRKGGGDGEIPPYKPSNTNTNTEQFNPSTQSPSGDSQSVDSPTPCQRPCAATWASGIAKVEKENTDDADSDDEDDEDDEDDDDENATEVAGILRMKRLDAGEEVRDEEGEEEEDMTEMARIMKLGVKLRS